MTAGEARSVGEEAPVARPAALRDLEDVLSWSSGDRDAFLRSLLTRWLLPRLDDSGRRSVAVCSPASGGQDPDARHTERHDEAQDDPRRDGQLHPDVDEAQDHPDHERDLDRLA